MLTEKELEFLKLTAKKIRKDILQMSFNAQSAHTGGALSCVEILTALYFHVLKINPTDANDDMRDRVIFSKAHDAKALYAVLCERGFFSKEILEGYEKNGGKLPGHSTRHCVPGVEVSTGSLGHGLSIASGVAYSGKLDKKDFRVFAVLSDGECDEGSTWEAILWARHHRLDNLIAIVDYNKLQGFGETKNILNLEPFAKKWEYFGWSAIEVDGHNIQELVHTLIKIPLTSGKPSVIIANTVKGLGGIPMHINKVSSQYKPPTEQELKDAIEKLDI